MAPPPAPRTLVRFAGGLSALLRAVGVELRRSTRARNREGRRWSGRRGQCSVRAVLPGAFFNFFSASSIANWILASVKVRLPYVAYCTIPS